MATQIGTSAAIDSALRRGFSEASVRLQPDTRMTDVIAALGTIGVTVEVQDGVLVLAQGSTMMNTALALRNFAARPEHTKFFVQHNNDPRKWTLKEKAEYLNDHTVDEYQRLCTGPVLDAGIKTLDANMSRADYAQLTRAEKSAFISEFGIAGVESVMGKKK